METGCEFSSCGWVRITPAPEEDTADSLNRLPGNLAARGSPPSAGGRGRRIRGRRRPAHPPQRLPSPGGSIGSTPADRPGLVARGSGNSTPGARFQAWRRFGG